MIDVMFLQNAFIDHWIRVRVFAVAPVQMSD
jgi:hypothetical protein